MYISKFSEIVSTILNVVLLVLFSAISYGTNEKIGSDYGPYKMFWQTYETCKGPKQKDCGVFRIDNVQNMSNILFVLEFPKDCPVTTARVTIGSKQSNNVTKKLWNYGLDKPCQHFVLGPILTESFNLTETCKIKKGNYEVHLNMVEKTAMFLGTNFFYGTYDFKVTAHNKFSNFFCVHTVIDVMKVSK